MGLRDLRRQVIEHEAVWWVRDWLRRALAGEKGPEMQRLAGWFITHRTEMGGFLAAVSVVLEGGYKAHVPHMTSDWFSTAAYVLFTVGTTVFGAGKFKSDEYHLDRIDDGNNR
jgi:hypothetical protein